MEITDRDLIGDVPDGLRAETRPVEFGQFLFGSGSPRALSREFPISSGRIATMTRLVQCSPRVGTPGQYVAVRHYKDRLLKGEIFLNGEDVVRLAKKFSSGAQQLSDCAFPGLLKMRRAGHLIKIEKYLDPDVAASLANGQADASSKQSEPLVSDVALTTEEMSNFARSVSQAL